MIAFFKKLPPSISIPVFYGFITLSLVFRFLFTSAYGTFLLVVCVYLYIKENTIIKPLSMSELMDWIFLLPAEYKVALLSSSVTIIGFVVAFHTATANWKNQMRAQLKAQAAGEIENFFSVVARNITTASLYVESLIEAVNKIQKGTTVGEANFIVEHLQGRAGEYMAARDILSQASIDVHQLIGRNNNLLSTGWGLLSAARIAADSLASIANKMWIHIPIVDLNDPNRIQEFVNQVNVTECNEFLESSKINSGKIVSISGGVQGYLTSPIWGFTFPMYVNLVASRRDFKEAINEFHKQLNNES